MPYRRKVRLQELPKAVSGKLIGVFCTVAQLHQRIGGAPVGKNNHIVLDQYLCNIGDASLVGYLWIVTSHHVDNAKNPPVPDGFGNRPEAAKTPVQILHGKSDFCRHLIRRNINGNPLPVLKAFDSSADYFFRQRPGVRNIGVMAVKFHSLCSGQTRGSAGCDHRCPVAFCDIHYGRKYILYVRDPEIQSSGHQHKFCRDGIRQRDDTVISVHSGKAAAADPVKTYSFCSFFLCQRKHFFCLPAFYNFLDKKWKMPVHRDIHISLFQGSDIYLGGYSVAYTKQCVCGNGSPGHSGKAERKSAAEKLFHGTLPVSVRSDCRLVISLKHLMVSADRHQIQILPELYPVRRRTDLGGFVNMRRIRTGQIIQKCLRQIIGDILQISSLCGNAKAFCRGKNLLLSQNRRIQLSFRRPHQFQHQLSCVHAVLCGSRSRRAKQVSGDNQIRVCPAHASFGLLGDPAGSHVADFAADSGKAEIALWLLPVKPVKSGIYSQLLRTYQHFADSRIRCLINLILLGRKGLAIRGNRVHVITDKRVLLFFLLFRFSASGGNRVSVRVPFLCMMRMMMLLIREISLLYRTVLRVHFFRIMGGSLQDHRGNPVLIKSDQISVAVNMLYHYILLISFITAVFSQFFTIPTTLRDDTRVKRYF